MSANTGILFYASKTVIENLISENSRAHFKELFRFPENSQNRITIEMSNLSSSHLSYKWIFYSFLAGKKEGKLNGPDSLMKFLKILY